MNNIKVPDWAIRSVKTFVQVFIATLISALWAGDNVPPVDWGTVPAWLLGVFTPQLILGDCLAAALCAVWNIRLEKTKKGAE